METTSLDVSVIADVRAGNAEAMERLLERYEPRLLRYVQRHIPATLRATVDAVDVLQDTYFNAFRRLHHFEARDESSAYRWLAAIARHQLINLANRQGALKRGSQRAAVDLASMLASDDSFQDLLAQLAVSDRTPSRGVIAREIADLVEAGIGRLLPTHQKAIQLRYFKGMTVADVAKAFGKAEGAVKMLLSRALKALRAELGSASNYR